MWSSWFGSSKSKDSVKMDAPPEAHAKKRSNDPEHKATRTAKQHRVSRSWFETRMFSDSDNTPVEQKPAMYNLLDVPDEPFGDLSKESGMSSGMPTSPSQRFSAYLETHRISNRPLYIVRQSDSDILRFKENHFRNAKRENRGKFITIPILPADEMNSLTSEIKTWYKNRRNYKITFVLTLICALLLGCSTWGFATVWYSNTSKRISGISFKNFHREGSYPYNVHMVAEVSTLLLMAFGQNIFRLFPATKLVQCICYHALIFVLGFVTSLIGIYWAIQFHNEFAKDSDHFYSLHSWMGLVSYILYLFCFFSGWWLLYYPANTVKKVHSRVSIFTFMLSGVATLGGFSQRAILQIKSTMIYVTAGIVANCTGVLIVIFCVLVRLNAAFVYRRRAKPQWDVIVYRSMEAIEDVYLEIHDMYDSFELWVKQVNQARMKVLHVPRSSIRSSLGSEKVHSGRDSVY